MTDTEFILVLVGWMAIGLGLAVVMGRRGHNAFGWGVVGAILGPLALVLAYLAHRDRRVTAPKRLRAPAGGDGPVDVLIGIDGSPQAEAAARAAIGLFGERLGRVTLAGVVPFDEAAADEREMTATLRAMSSRPDWQGAGVELLHGRAADALEEEAVTDGYDVLVIGARGAGRSKAILGSAASQLAKAAKTPVLLVGDG